MDPPQGGEPIRTEVSVSDEALGSASGTTAEATPASPAATALATPGETKQPALVVSPERDVANALAAGKSMESILTERRQQDKGRATATRIQPGSQPTATSTPAPGQPGTEAGAAAGEDLGLNDKELGALSRGKFDLALLKLIPATNRKALARKFMASQAETDRQYQLAKAGKAPNTPAGGDAAAQAAAEAGESRPLQDAETPPMGEGEAGNGKAPAPAAAAAQAAPTPIAGPTFALSEQDRGTLVEIGGEAFADTYTKHMQGVASHVYQTQVQPLQNVIGFLANKLDALEFDDAFTDLSKQPGFTQLGEAEKKSIKERVPVLLRAAGNQTAYGIPEAVMDAAASLFRTNIHQAVQASLVTQRNQSLAGGADRGTNRNTPSRAMDEVSRTRAIGQYMASHPGVKPRDAAMAVDSA